MIKKRLAVLLILTFLCSDTASSESIKDTAKVSSALSNAINFGPATEQPSETDEISTAESGKTINMDESGMVQVYITLYELNRENLQELGRAGVAVEIYDEYRNLVQARVYPGQVEQVTELDFVKFVDLPDYGYSNAGSVQTEGDSVIRADQVRALGFTGAGVRVGVISDGINRLAQSVNSGNLPSGGIRVPASRLTGGGISLNSPCPAFTTIKATPSIRPDLTNGAEGTALLEIIHDIAPGAQLFFAPGLTSSLEHRRARRCLTQAVDIIADDIVFFNAGPYDGTSPVSLEAADSVSAGVANFIAVGNQAKRHYQGAFTDTDGDTFHEFDRSLNLPPNNNSGETLNVTVRPGGTITVLLQWNDPFEASGNNYNLALVSPTNDPTSVIVVSGIEIVSDDVQNGDDDPTERVSFTNRENSNVTIGIRINRVGSAAVREFDMFVSGDLEFGPSGFTEIDEFQVPQSSVPNNADAELALSIGSVGLGSGDPLGQGPNEIRPFSSHGPTNDGRTKPDLVAPDGVSTSVQGFSPFLGTSAATPHAAGVAALILDKNPNLSPIDVENILKNTAVELGSQGVDNTFGFGRVDAFAAIQQVVAASPVPSPTPDFSGDESNGSGGGGCSLAAPLTVSGTGAMLSTVLVLLPIFVIGLRRVARKD